MSSLAVAVEKPPRFGDYVKTTGGIVAIIVSAGSILVGITLWAANSFAQVRTDIQEQKTYNAQTYQTVQQAREDMKDLKALILVGNAKTDQVNERLSRIEGALKIDR